MFQTYLYFTWTSLSSCSLDIKLSLGPWAIVLPPLLLVRELLLGVLDSLFEYLAARLEEGTGER